MVRFAFAATLAAFAATVSAQQSLTITAPNANTWWVAKSVNVMSWTCQTSPYTNFTVLIANSDPKILVAPMAFIGIQMNGDCSKEITQQQADQAAGTGYTILLADPFNNTNIYATSEPFEIKALGAAYPSQATPSTSGGANGTTGSGGTASPKPNGSSSLRTSAGLGLIAVGTALGLML
ncbi:hypothetical protein BDN72DRAFT_801092 [Pluteus cervinus]|uniref:Uncharacterized protein n=1 Tax=Pluteus cervinus TaxID=181527 RepID=A0ACD3AHZ1_9AGAR|nr:hypothetical protein BDN72DRAFT_801092 [Pluteus cervinus]